MTRLLVHVEGPTEEAFVNEVLSHHLYERGFTSVSARIVGNARERTRRGGIVSWEIARQGILSRLIEDSNRISTTMVDYYAMPLDWPGRADRFAQAASSAQIAENIEQALLADICANMDRNFNPNRFVPYVMMYEFEAMLFSDCDSFGHSIGRSGLIADLQAIRDDFDTPEEIDDYPDTAPSRRIESLMPAYQKPTMGVQAAQNIGLEAIRRECPHFADWLDRLEHLP